MAVSHHVVGEDDVRQALRQVLASETFTRSQQLSKLLRYLCDSLIAHGSDHIAEYTIGTEALGRPVDFDPTQDAVVRVEMHRLRRRLREYYQHEGAGDVVRIEIPPGRYAPVVTRTADDPEPNVAFKEDEAAAPEVREDLIPLEATQPVTVPSPPSTGRRIPLRGTIWWISVAAGLLGGVTVWSLPWHRNGTAIAGTHAEVVNSAGTIAATSPSLAVRIGCGRRSPWTDRLGQIWGPDQYFQGGEVIEIPARPYIAGAFDARLFQSARVGSFAYRVPLPARTYELRLYFVEPVFGPDNDQGGEGNRLFNLAINGRQVLDRFDILTDADGPWTADERVFKDVVPGPDGTVKLDFQAIDNGALLNAIEFVPARPHVLNPVRLLPQDNFYTDSAGNLWTPDQYDRGGRVAIHPGPVKNTRDREIFRHERFGRFRYAVPVDRGLYSVYLYMSEQYWGPGNPGGGGVGTRVFSVFCNGTALLRSFDLFKEVGINYGVVRAFHHIAPNAQGKLLLSFEPEHDYASIYALEVIDESGPDTPSWTRTVEGSGAN